MKNCPFTYWLYVFLQLKQMEVQLEEEYDEKQKVLKEKRELESKLMSAQDKVGWSPFSLPLSWSSSENALDGNIKNRN